MISFYKKNKLLTILILITSISFIMGLLLPAFLNKNDISSITNNIHNTLAIYKKNSYNYLNFGKIFFQSLLSISIIWLLGISLIGLPIIIILYSFKVYIVGAEVSFLLYKYKLTKILFITLYQLPKLVECILLFYLVFYAIEFSLLLFRLFFLNNEVKIKIIMKKYLKVLFVVLLLFLILVSLEVFLLPKVLNIMG